RDLDRGVRLHDLAATKTIERRRPREALQGDSGSLAYNLARIVKARAKRGHGPVVIRSAKSERCVGPHAEVIGRPRLGRVLQALREKRDPTVGPRRTCEHCKREKDEKTCDE